MTYIPDSTIFSPEEFVPETVFNELGGDPIRIFRLFDERVLVACVTLRQRYGVMTINNWMWGGRFHNRGYRPPWSDVGAKYSDHRMGRAIDCHFRDVSAEEVRQDILADPWAWDFWTITSLEMTVDTEPINWLHFSCRNWNKLQHGIEQLYL